MNTELIQRLEAWAESYENGSCAAEPTAGDMKEHAGILRQAAAGLRGAEVDRETCESGDPACGPVAHHDSEGVPLCQTCWDSLASDGAS